MPSDRRRHQPYPVEAGNIHVPAHRTITIGWCLDCRGAIRLVYNEDLLETIIAHVEPACRAWQHHGTLSLAKSTPHGPVTTADGSGPVVAP